MATLQRVCKKKYVKNFVGEVFDSMIYLHGNNMQIILCS